MLESCATLVLADAPLAMHLGRASARVQPLHKRAGLTAVCARACALAGLPPPSVPACADATLVRRFAGVAGERIAHAIDRFRGASADDACALIAELHALADEATIIGQHEIAHLARAADAYAARWSALGRRGGLLGCARCLAALARLVKQLARTGA